MRSGLGATLDSGGLQITQNLFVVYANDRRVFGHQHTAARLNCKKVRALNALISPRRPEAPVQREKRKASSTLKTWV
jgi:hypothetical protein